VSESKEQVPGEIDFSDGELSEMGVELAGRDSAAPPTRRSRSMLRVPVDEVPRPQGASDPRALAPTTEPSLPALSIDPDPGDEVVEHAFANGGIAEGLVPAEVRLAATPARDELEAFTAKLIADRDEDRVVEIDASPEEDTDPKALAQARAEQQTAAASPPSSPRPLSPALAALARAVAVPSEPSDWLSPSEVTESAASPASAEALDELPDADDDAEMELDGAELEDVEPMVPPERQRTLTPIVPPPTPDGNGHAAEAPANGNGAAAAGAMPATPMPPARTGPMALPPPPPLTPHPHPVAPHAPPSTPVLSSAPPPGPASSPPVAAAPPPAAAPASPAAAPPSSDAMIAPTIPLPVPGMSSGPLLVPPPALPVPEVPLRPRRKRRAKQWFEEIFDDDYLRTLPFLTPRQTEREAQFIADSLQIPSGGALLDLACGYGRHAMELAAKNYKVTGLDLSLPLLIRAADAARRVGVNVNFIHGDMRETTFENEFDGAYCMFTSFGYFDDDTNRKVAANLARAIKPGGKLLVDVVNRDYLCRDLPTRVWWQGDGCVVLEEVDFNYFSSRLQVQRSIIFEDGRQVEQEISIRAYSLHEIGKVLHHSGFRVTEVSGGLSLRGKFFGANSRQLIVVAEKKVTP
jgi:SAM-dependent methyltransferase